MALVAEILGGIGIIVSILYLAYEVSQNTETQALTNHLTLASQIADLRHVIVQDAELIRIVQDGHRNFASLGEIDRARYNEIVSGWLDVWQNALQMAKAGQLDSQELDGWGRAICFAVSQDGGKHAWSSVRIYYEGDVDFVNSVDRCLDDQLSQ